jgi:hypothetical protein
MRDALTLDHVGVPRATGARCRPAKKGLPAPSRTGTRSTANHINHIFTQTALRDGAQLVAYAFRLGLAAPS